MEKVAEWRALVCLMAGGLIGTGIQEGCLISRRRRGGEVIDHIGCLMLFFFLNGLSTM